MANKRDLEMDRTMANLFGGQNMLTSDEDKRNPYANQDINEIKKRAAAYLDKMEFVPGDVIVWKEGLQNRKIPNYGEPVVVVEVFDSPRYEDLPENGGTPMSMEPITGRFGIIDTAHDDFDCFPVDLARFERYVAEAKPVKSDEH